jgi:hypothetical protein
VTEHRRTFLRCASSAWQKCFCCIPKIAALLIRKETGQATLTRINNGFSLVSARFGYASATNLQPGGVYQLSLEKM